MYKIALLAAAAVLGGVSVASAADLGGSYKDEPAASYGPGYSWAGLYVGGSAGFGVGDLSTTPELVTGDRIDGFLNPALAALFSADSDIDGAVYGAHVGYNFQRGNIVFGVEAGINGTDMDGSTDIIGLNLLETESELDYYATVTARLGYAVDKTLFYGFGGVAFGTVNTTVTSALVPGASLESETDHVGWTAGLGIEHAMTERFIVRIEYAHVDLGEESENYSLSGVGSIPLANNVDLEFDTIKIGASYKFGGREHDALK